MLFVQFPPQISFWLPEQVILHNWDNTLPYLPYEELPQKQVVLQETFYNLIKI